MFLEHYVWPNLPSLYIQTFWCRERGQMGAENPQARNQLIGRVQDLLPLSMGGRAPDTPPTSPQQSADESSELDDTPKKNPRTRSPNSKARGLSLTTAWIHDLREDFETN